MRPNAALKISLLLTLLSASAAHAFAQEGLKPNSAKERDEVKTVAQSGSTLDPQLRLRARDLASATADEALKWEDKQTAVRVLAQAADLLWADYPERSRAWLTRAWEMTGQVVNEGADEATRRFRNNSPRSRSRAIVLTVAQKHDRQLAESLLEHLTDESAQSQDDSQRGIFDNRTARSEQLLNMAAAIVESDPVAAANLAERSLEDGVSFQLQNLLLALRKRDKAIADRLFDAAVNRLLVRFTHPSEGHILASYLFTPGRVLGAGRDRVTALAVGSQTPSLRNTPAEDDPARARRFLRIMQRLLLVMPPPSATANPAQSAQEFVMLSGSLAEGFKLYAPELWMPVQQRMAQALPDLKPSIADNRLPSSVRENLKLTSTAGVDNREFNRLYVESLKETAEKESDPVARKLTFVQAALATEPAELESGRRIAAKIDEADLREQVISFLVYRTALLELEKGRLDEAIELAAEAKPIQRAIILTTAAQRIVAKRTNAVEALIRKSRALNLLSEVEKLLERGDLPSEALRVRVGLVAALTPLDPVRALEVFSKVVAAVNNDPAFDASDTSAPRIANLAGASNSLLPRINSGYGLKDAMTLLASADFEGATIIASKLSAPSVRGTCLMEIAGVILTSDATKQPGK
jgi:hypothetical protein